MSPARSHIEQSRNTLLFASCAKEVVTSARVNVVMSDKALVKHLQRELARLEGELKYPRPSPISHFETLLREKDAQIKQMEKEIKALIQQRDLAQTRVQDLLRAVGGGCPSSKWDECSQITPPSVCKGDLSTAESSLAYKMWMSYGSDGKKANEEEQNVRSLCPSNRSPMLMESIPRQREKTAQESDDTEDICKEVRCIEMDGPMRHGARENEGVPPVTSDSLRETNPSGQMEPGPTHPSLTYITLEQHVQDVRERLNNLVRANPYESYPRSSVCDLSSSRGLGLSRSRSCRATVMQNSSPWFEEGEHNNNTTPPNSSNRDLSGRTERFRRRFPALDYGTEIGTPGEDSQNFERNTCNSVFDGESVTSVAKGSIANIQDFVAGLKEARVQYQKQLNDQEMEQNPGEDEFGTRETTRGIGLDPIIDPLETPSRWPIEFEKKQQEIIGLWHKCNVALAHRTYFFLLFKGDPSDSIYMEVELRRLSFMQRTFSREKTDTKTPEGAQNNMTLASSLRRLRREREMLFRQMPKRLSAEERESLYTKWGIALDSKQRKWQLVRRLWTETRDLEHVRESASIVAKLIGLSEAGQALKEMFGLSFVPEGLHSRRSFKWKI